MGGSLSGVVVNKLSCNIIESEFKVQSIYLGLFFYKDGFGIE